MAPTTRERRAKDHERADRHRRAMAEEEEKSKENRSPILMNSDGSYTSQGALAPESPYATSQENKPAPSSVTGPSSDTNRFQIPSQAGFNFGSGPSTSFFSSPSPATNGFNSSPKPNWGVTFGQGLTATSSPQASTNISNITPTSSTGFDPRIISNTRQISFPEPNLPVNANTVEVPSLNELFRSSNTQSSASTSVGGPQEDKFFQRFDLGMRMRSCRDDPDELNNCIVEMDKRDHAAKDKLKDATSTLIAKDACISILERDNETIKAEARTVHDQQAKQLTAKDEEIAKLKAAHSDLEKMNTNNPEQNVKDLEARDSQISELRRKFRDSEDKYNAFKDFYEQEKLKFKRESEEKELDIEQHRATAHANSKQFDTLRQQANDANIQAKKSEEHARSSERMVKEQADTIKEQETRKGGLQRANQSLRDELKTREEEIKSIKLEKSSGPADHRDCIAKQQRLEYEKTQGINDMERQCKLELAEVASRTEEELKCLLKAQEGLPQDIDKLQLRIHEHEQTIRKLQQENRQLQSKVEDHKQNDVVGSNPREKQSVDVDTQNPDFLSSTIPNNELSDFSPAMSHLATPASSPRFIPGEWRPQTASMMGDSDDGDDEGQRPVTWSHTGPRTIASFEPSDGYSDHDITPSQPVGQGLGLPNMSFESCDQGTQTDTTPLSAESGKSQVATICDSGFITPKLSISKPMVIVDTAPSLPPKLNISKLMTVMNDEPSSPPKLDVSKVLTIMDTKPSGTESSMSKPTSTVNETLSSPPKLSISKPTTIINDTPSSTPQLGLPEPRSLDDSKSNNPKLSIRKPVTIVDNSPSLPMDLSLSKLKTVIDLSPSASGLSISKPIAPVSNTQSISPKLDISQIATVIDSAPNTPDMGINTPTVIIDGRKPTASKPDAGQIPTTVGSAPDVVAVAEPNKQITKKSSPGWRWLWYLLLLFVIIILTLAASYGESARRERNMWLEANDFTRRAVYSVQLGCGTGTSVPAWLWNDQLLGT
ncbi:MAG: hypothetical protein Q9169_002801 [Polycauliona sp. 2 TL-2023]